MSQRFDIAIVGAGPVGLVLALTLARFAPGVQVAILDRRPLTVPHDARASALSAGGASGPSRRSGSGRLLRPRPSRCGR